MGVLRAVQDPKAREALLADVKKHVDALAGLTKEHLSVSGMSGQHSGTGSVYLQWYWQHVHVLLHREAGSVCSSRCICTYSSSIAAFVQHWNNGAHG